MDLFCTTLTRTGTSLTADLLAKIGIPTYYSRKRIDIFSKCNVNPNIGITVIMNHLLDKCNTQPGSMRIIRNPEKGFISYFTWLQTLYHDNFIPDMETIIDMNMFYSGGSLFGLGYIEEYFLQNILLQNLLGPQAIFRFENFKESYLEFSALLQYMHLKLPLELIKDVFNKQKEEDSNNTRNRSAYMVSPQKLMERVALMMSLCGELGYTTPANVKILYSCSWPKDILHSAAMIHQKLCHVYAKNRLANFDSRLLAHMLYNIYDALDKLPLLSIHLAGCLLLKNKHVKFALDHLLQHAHSNNPYLSLPALALVNMFDKKFSQILMYRLMQFNKRYNYSVTSQWWPSNMSPMDHNISTSIQFFNHLAMI